MQHLVARLPGALLSRGLFPYLGGKRNRETERGPKLASRRLPARAALSGEGDDGSSARLGDHPPAVRQLQGLPPLLEDPQLESSLSRLPAYYGTAALHPVPRSLASPAATLHCGALPPGSEPAPSTDPRARIHTLHTQTRAHIHTHARAHAHTQMRMRSVGTCAPLM